MPPKKGKKMDIGDFLADDSLGGTSWADGEVDLNSLEFSVGSATAVPTGPVAGPAHGNGSYASAFASRGGDRGGDRQGGFEQRERKEFPIPDAPPYRVRVANLPWELEESEVARFFEESLQAEGIITDLNLPVDRETGKLRGTAFVTFTEREVLEEALKLTGSDFAGRRIFVNVAAPINTAFEGDWRSSRSGPLEGGRREDVEIDWGSARGGGVLPPRERRGGDRFGAERGDRPERFGAERGERGPRPEEPEIDWSSARGSGVLPPRERRERPEREGGFERGERSERPPRKEEPEIDWSSARGSGVLPPRERSNRSFERGDRPERTERPKREEPEIDWSSARGTGVLPPRERSNRSERPERTERPKKEEPALDWKRGQGLPPRAPRQPRVASSAGKKTAEDKKEDQPKPQKSAFSVLSVEGEESDEEHEKPQAEAETTETVSEDLAAATENLTVQDEQKDAQGWEVVGK